MFDLVDLSKQAREVAEWDLSSEPDDVVLAAVVGLEEVRSQVELAEAHALSVIQSRSLTDRCFGMKTGQWVAAQAKVERSGVARRMRLGGRLRRLSLVDDAVVSGALSVDHAAVLARHAANPRVGDQVEATQSVWIDLAVETSFVDWEHQLDHTVTQLDQDGGYDPNRDLARNKLRITPLPDGSVGLAGELVGEQALVVRDCVEAHADRLYHRLRRDHDLCPELPMPTRATLLAMALAELVLWGSTVDLEHSKGPATDVTLVIEATRPDTLDHDRTALIDRGPANDDEVGLADLFDPYTRTDPARSVGLMDLCGPVTTPNGHHVPHHVAEVLLCDPAITALIVDSLGVALDLGRTTRFATREQRRALAKRDGGCVFPGCDAPVGWCDAHHVIDWHHGGHTNLDNLALLCRYHHGVSHRAGWTMTALPDQTFTWRTPLSQTLHSQRHRGRSPTA